MKFAVDIQETVYRNEDQHGDGEWDYSWTDDHNFSYNRARIVDTGSNVDLFPGEAEVAAGNDIYVVYVSYDTGDSFGNSRGERVHLWAFSDKARAHRLCHAIEVDATASPDYDYDHKPLTFDDVPIPCNTWKGYFENFNGAEVETIAVRHH
jgi:hypothetical protein